MNGAELKDRRERLGLTQGAVAERLSITTPTLRSWESEPGAIPVRAEMLWGVWEHRFQQESPHIGPVTLIYTSGPMFIDPQGPRRPLAMMQQEPYLTNAAALARCLALWGRSGFESPLIMQESGDILWNVVQLGKIADNLDAAAPTVPVMLRAAAAYVRAYSDRYVRSGPRLHTPAEIEARRRDIEAEADKLDALAELDTPTSTDCRPYEAIHNQLNLLGFYPRGDMIAGIHHAYAARDQVWPVS